jgi:hypothetical protein
MHINGTIRNQRFDCCNQIFTINIFIVNSDVNE